MIDEAPTASLVADLHRHSKLVASAWMRLPDHLPSIGVSGQPAFRRHKTLVAAAVWRASSVIRVCGITRIEYVDGAIRYERRERTWKRGYSLPRVDFDQLPDDARLWIFPAERPLGEAEHARLLPVVDRFIDQWGAHAVPLTAARELRYDRFLLVAVDERHAGPSGCSIDALFRQIKTLEQELGMALVDVTPVEFRQGSTIERVSRDRFAELAAAGTVSLETTLFDNTVTCVGDLRAGRWETRAANAWHARAFFS